RQELEQQKQGNVLSRWLNRPWVLLPLFLLCVGIIVWRLWLDSHRSPEWLLEQGSALMASEDPADWDKAWEEYLGPLRSAYPNYASQEVQGYARQVRDREALRRALDGVKEAGPASTAQRFYQRGLRLCQQGDGEEARRIWENVVQTFGNVD